MPRRHPELRGRSWPIIPEPVTKLLDAALVGELTVVDGNGRPVTYPLIPLWDGEKVYLTSSTLFSRKLEHIRGNPKVSLSITDPGRVGGAIDRATIQGDARVIEEDPHGGWERLLPIWEKKEPSIVYFLKAARRAAALLRAGADRDHPAPRPVLGGRRHGRRAGRDHGRNGGRVMRSTPEVDARTGLEKLATYPYQILTWVDDAGYPVSVAVDARINAGELSARFEAPAGLAVPTDREVSLTGSHIRPQPGYGYDERRHVTVWGPATISRRRPSPSPAAPRGAGTRPRSRSSSTRSAPSASRARYFDALSAERGTPVKPRAVVRVPDPADDAPAVPDRDDRAGHAGHPDRRLARVLRPRSPRC